VGEVLRSCGGPTQHQLTLKHPMTMSRVVGADTVHALAGAAGGLLSSTRIEHVWNSPQINALCWVGQFQNLEILGVTTAQRTPNGVELDIFFNAFPGSLREALYRVSAALVAPADWSLPPGINTALPPLDPNEVLDAKLPFALADHVTLSSPVANRPIRGLAEVERVCGHTVAVYGTRQGGPRLTSDARTLSVWTGSVAGLPLEVANIIRWCDPRTVDAMTMAMRPWPVVALFQERMRARTRSFIDPAYFGEPSDVPAPGQRSPRLTEAAGLPGATQ
jgi:hypothetical protein